MSGFEDFDSRYVNGRGAMNTVHHLAHVLAGHRNPSYWKTGNMCGDEKSRPSLLQPAGGF
jgi:hypothetical protein